MASRYSTFDDIHQFELERGLHKVTLMAFINLNCMRQQARQKIHTNISELQVLWDKLAFCDSLWPNTEAAKV